MQKIRFEYIFAMALTVILTAALFVFSDDAQMANLIVGALVAAFGSITAYFFTKHKPGDK